MENCATFQIFPARQRTDTQLVSSRHIGLPLFTETVLEGTRWAGREKLRHHLEEFFPSLPGEWACSITIGLVYKGCRLRAATEALDPWSPCIHDNNFPC